MRLLRLLEGQARRQPARRALPRAARGDRPPRRRGVGPRRDRGLPPGRDPPVVRRRLLRLGRPRDQGRGARDARARLQRARGLAGRRDARRPARATTSTGCATRASPRCPGTAAEVLDDEVRAVICPDKITTAQWLEVHRTAHRGRSPLEQHDHVRPRRRPPELGPPPRRRARPAARDGRLHRVRAAAVRPHGGADLPEGQGPSRARRSARCCSCTPSGASRCIRGSRTSRSRGSRRAPPGVAEALRAGVNDLGGTLMNESISRSAGAGWGQEMPPEQMEALIRSTGRIPRQRTTTLRRAPARAGRPLVRRRAARRAVEPARQRGAARATEAARPACQLASG